MYIKTFTAGVYSTPDPALAEHFATTFEYQGSRYKVLVQNRVNMEDTEVITRTGEDCWTSGGE